MWVVIEPLGGKKKIDKLSDLELYVRSKMSPEKRTLTKPIPTFVSKDVEEKQESRCPNLDYKAIVEATLAPQIERLKQSGVPIIIDQNIVAYVAAMISALKKSEPNLDEVRVTIARLIPTREAAQSITDACERAKIDHGYALKVEQIFSRVTSELKTKNGDFLEKYSIKKLESIQNMFDPVSDYFGSPNDEMSSEWMNV
jgi:hypothetical protein